MLEFTLCILFLLVLVTACYSGRNGNDKLQAGLINNRLSPCPTSPNCVCSENQGFKSSIAPVHYLTNHNQAWENAQNVIRTMGGKIVDQDNLYIHAIFTSRIFRFVDDFELRLDEKNKVIHLRSASRTGKSDLGVNRRRAEKFRELFTVKQK